MKPNTPESTAKPTVITLQPIADGDSDALRVKAILGEGDDIDLVSLSQLDADVSPGAQVTLYARDFKRAGTAYRVFAVTLGVDGTRLAPWVTDESGCRATFIMPARGDSGPRFAICAVSDESGAPALRPFVSGSGGHAGGLPIKMGDPEGPGPGTS